MPRRRNTVFTPLTIAIVYVLVGGVWILLSDRVVHLAIDDPALESRIQTVKGWLFVAVSALVLYALVSWSQRELAASTERLDKSIRQTSILHRILRHNLRNTCNVILGNAELLRRGEHEHDGELLDAIHRQATRLIEISEKTGQLREVLLEDATMVDRLDVATIVERSVERARSRYPGATIRVDGIDRAAVDAHPLLETSIDELLENAVEHNDRPEPTVTVTVERPDGGPASITIADDGPGLPAMERDVLEEGLEKPMFHSEGLGLWVVQTIVTESGGRLHITDNEPCGSAITMIFE